ncbi:MAG: hypothetical protein ACTHK4_12685, partial [Mycobacteriales bacterium]
FKIPAHAHAGKPTPLTWHATGVGSDKVVLQGLNGHTWEKFRTLHGSKGSTTIPKEPIGIYDIRIAVYNHAGRLVTAKGHKLHVFGKVSWKRLFSKATPNDSGTYGSFSYVFRFFSNDVDYNALKISNNPCSSVHVEYIPGTQNPNEHVSGEGTVMIGRHGESSVTSQAAAQTVGRSHASLPVGKTWSVNLSEPGNGTRTFTWYFNGSGICDQTVITTFQANQN